MKKIVLASVLALGCASAFADTAAFTGFNAAVGLNFGNSSAKANLPGSSASMGEDSAWGTLSGEYGFALGSNAVLGVGASFDLGDTKYGTTSLGKSTSTWKATDKYSVYVAPGYAINKDTLAFVKIGVHHAKGQIDAVDIGSFNGIGFGLGVRTLMTKNLYLQLEATRIDYSSKDYGSGVSIKPTSTFGTLSVGYHF